MSITKANINPDGDLYLFTSSGSFYRLGVYWIESSYDGSFSHRTETSSILLNLLSSQIQSATMVSFAATYAFVVTWYQNPAKNNSALLNSYQTILVTDGTYSFLVYNYERLDQVSSGGASFFTDPNGNIYNVLASLTGSTYNVPGQFIYRVETSEIFSLIIRIA
jgi:hypothetical protein